MKRIIDFLIELAASLLGAFALCYLTGVFIYNNFRITQWESNVSEIMGWFFMIAACCCFAWIQYVKETE